jgi:hypothetical protein
MKDEQLSMDELRLWYHLAHCPSQGAEHSNQQHVTANKRCDCVGSQWEHDGRSSIHGVGYRSVDPSVTV